MKLIEAKKLCHEHGIHQLRKGETLADALNHINNSTERTGYKHKYDDGRPMDENAQIRAANREALKKSLPPIEYTPDNVECIDDITDENDFREDKGNRGAIANCYYCGDCIRIDGFNDYETHDKLTHCSDCMSQAIYENCM